MDPSEIANILAEFISTDAEHLWLIDEKVFFEDGLDEFRSNFDLCPADLLATEVRTHSEDAHWHWWKSLRAPDGENPLTHGVAALLPLMRLSRAAVEVILRGIDEGWTGHPEAMLPTLVNRAGLVIEDVGGIGQFTPPDRIGRWYDERTWHWKGPVTFVEGMLHYPLTSPGDVVSPSQPAAKPVVAFLFLTRGDVNHPQIWREYLNEAGDSAKVLAHTKDTSQLAEDSFLAHAQIREKVDTAWGSISLVHATLALLRAALEDGESTHFILVSESCVPVRPFDDLSSGLRLDDRSRIRVSTQEEVRRAGHVDKARVLDAISGIEKKFALFQHQWMCLCREDALIVTEKDWTPFFKNVYVPDECFFATVLAASGKSPMHSAANRQLTWSDWHRGGDHPQNYVQVLPRVAAQIAESGCYFARKFAPGSDIGRWSLHSRRISSDLI
jgi:hypothetical protein